MNVLVIDVGGTHVKALATGRRTPVKIRSGPQMMAEQMVQEVLAATAGWRYAAVSIGYPGPVKDNVPLREPANLGAGWIGFAFETAFGCPVKVVNDAAMQALGHYRGGRMLFLGLGTGLGTTLIIDGVVASMEVAHLPYKKGRTYEDYLGKRGLKRRGRARWERHVAEVSALLRAAFVADDVVIGGGNEKLLRVLPPGTRRGDNRLAFAGGYRLWRPAVTPAPGVA
jgi:polyphosphate glucokinase